MSTIPEDPPETVACERCAGRRDIDETLFFGDRVICYDCAQAEIDAIDEMPGLAYRLTRYARSIKAVVVRVEVATASPEDPAAIETAPEAIVVAVSGKWQAAAILALARAIEAGNEDVNRLRIRAANPIPGT